MKPINQITDQARQSLQKDAPGRSTQINSKFDRVIDRLFVRMNSIYGHLWSSRFQTENMLKAGKHEWGTTIADCTLDQIGNAIELCKDKYPKPPTLPEFLALCTGKGKNEFGLDYVPEVYREQRQERLLTSDYIKSRRKSYAQDGVKAMRDELEKD